MHWPIRSSFSLLCLLLLAGCRHVPEERFLADAQINGKPVRFAYDTGAGGTALFTRPAKRLGLKVFKPLSIANPAPGEVSVGHTGFCRFTTGGETFTVKLSTLHLPWPIAYMFDVDGLIGWPDMRDDFLDIDAAQDVIRGIDELPDTSDWLILPIYQRASVLAVQIPRADGKTGVIEIDTGNPGGLSLSPERWNEWRTAHPHARAKRNIAFMPGSGTGIDKAFNAEDLSLGPLTWKNIGVHKANRTEMSIVSRGDVFEASMGIAALKPFHFIVDQRNHAAYFHLRADSSTPKMPNPAAYTNSVVHLRLREHEYRDIAQDAFESKNFTNALDEINKLLAVDPDDVESLYFRGDVHYSLCQWDEAEQDFLRVIQLNPDNANYPQYYLWVIRSRSGDRAAADKSLAAYIGKAQKSGGDQWETKIGAFLLGKLTEAELFRAILTQRGDFSARECEAWYYAGVKRRLAGEFSTARKYFRKSLATRQKDEDEYGFAAAELGTLH